MKAFIFAVLIAVIAASPAAAAKKKSKKVVAAPAATSTASNNENSWRFARDSLPIFLPSWTMPIYVATQKPKQ
jgi:hypothetical protein